MIHPGALELQAPAPTNQLRGARLVDWLQLGALAKFVFVLYCRQKDTFYISSP